jgi:hypothetical protein
MISSFEIRNSQNQMHLKEGTKKRKESIQIGKSQGERQTTRTKREKVKI